MAKLLDWDPLRGLEQWEDKTIDGKLQIHTRQDVEPVLELAKYERINGLADKAGKASGQDIYLYARIPPVVILELKHKYGVDLFNKDHMKKAFYLINTEYPHLRCTDKKHFLKH